MIFVVKTEINHSHVSFIWLCSVSESLLLTRTERNLLNSHDDIYSRQNSWSLVYRATRDGDRGKDFHEKCDGLCPILLIIKSKTFNHVFGGFSHFAFTSNDEYVCDPKKRNWLFRVRFEIFGQNFPQKPKKKPPGVQSKQNCTCEPKLLETGKFS